MAKPAVVAIDIGNTKLALALMGSDGVIVGKQTIPTEADKGVSQAISKVMCGVKALLQSGQGTATAMGIAFGGLVDETRQTALLSPNFPGWRNVPLVALLREAFPGYQVVMDNDANAAGWGEYRFGAAAGYRSAVYLTVSTGVGGTVILDGQLWRGKANGAGEFGHMIVSPGGPICGCGGRGCLEALVSGPSIARAAIEQAHGFAASGSELANKINGGNGDVLGHGIDARAVCGAARAGDALGLAIMNAVSDALAVALANIAGALAPEVIVLGGGVMNSADLFLPQAVQKAAAHLAGRGAEMPLVTKSASVNDIALLGAGALALDTMSEHK